MFKEKWLNLQLFAGEGAGDGGGEGAATGETNADAGHQRLLELGVPADKIRKNRAYKLNTPAPKPSAAEQSAGQEQKPEQAAAAENPTEEKTDAPSRMSWEEIMADPEYNQKMQETMQKRLRTAKGAEETLGKLTPALEVLARQYGLDPANIDYDALAKAINNDESFYEQKALEMGVSVETAKRMDQMDRDTERQQRTLEQQKFQNHIESLERQGEELKKVFPNFDLRKELQNKTFARLTAPDSPLSLEDAYYAVHRKEIQQAAMQVTAQKVAQKISNDIQSGSRRPDENGTSGQAPSVTTFDYRNASREQREALKKRIRSGEKIYPGQV
jgi:hypothetical protein